MANTDKDQDLQPKQPNDMVQITGQFWRSDLDFIDKLASHRLETRMDLRRMALHVGAYIIAAAGPPDRATGLYGKTFTHEELAQEIVDSDTTKAALFVERAGLTLVLVPTAWVAAMKEAFAGTITSARPAPTPAPAPVVVPAAANGQNTVKVSTAARKRMNFAQDVTL
jgi:hypothetical protein